MTLTLKTPCLSFWDSVLTCFNSLVQEWDEGGKVFIIWVKVTVIISNNMHLKWSRYKLLCVSTRSKGQWRKSGNFLLGYNWKQHWCIDNINRWNGIYCFYIFLSNLSHQILTKASCLAESKNPDDGIYCNDHLKKCNQCWHQVQRIKEALTKTFDWKLSQKCPACKCVGRVHGGDDQELHWALSSSLGAESFLEYLIWHFAFGEVERLSSRSFFLEKISTFNI